MCPVWFNIRCHHYCYNCKDKVGDFIKRVNKESLQSLFADKVHNKDLAIRDFVKVLTASLLSPYIYGQFFVFTYQECECCSGAPLGMTS